MSIPRDNYVGEPDYPSPWTTKNPREGLRDLDEARIVSLAPDVCLTPVGSAVCAIPYPIVDFCGHDKNYTSSVRFTRKKAMVMRSRTTHVHGDKAGVRKGIKSGTVGDVCIPVGHADLVRAEGSEVIRHLDRFDMNNGNTPGEALFVRGTSTAETPKDDDPVPGSMVARERPIEIALDMSSPEAKQLMEELLRRAPEKTPTQIPTKIPGGSTPSIPKSSPPAKLPPKIPTPPAGGGSVLQRLGAFGKILGPILTINNGGTPPELDNYIIAKKAAERELSGIHPLGQVERALYDQTKERMATHIAEAYGNPFSSPDQNYLNEEKSYLETTLQIERDKKLKIALENNVRVDTENKEDWPCVVGPYKYVEMICPGEAHHIIPDMVYRLGKAPASEAEKNSTENRIPNSPTYNQGQAICLSPGMHRTDDDAIHKSLNPALRTLGQGYKPIGTAPLGEIRNKAHLAIDQVSELPKKCKDMAKQAADEQVAGKRKQPGRTTMMPPKLPRDEKVIEVLKAGQYPGAVP